MFSINTQAATAKYTDTAKGNSNKVNLSAKKSYIKGEELQVYNKLLNDLSWQRKNGIIFNNNESTIDEHNFVDLDQDGVYEMLLHHGSCEADMTVSVVKYNNGNIKIQHLPISHGGYEGYSKSAKAFFIGSGNQGYTMTIGYKLEKGVCKKVFECTSEGDEVDKPEEVTYTVNGKKVSQAEYKKALAAFGKIS